MRLAGSVTYVGNAARIQFANIGSNPANLLVVEEKALPTMPLLRIEMHSECELCKVAKLATSPDFETVDSTLLIIEMII
jgi:hypothetical protein